MEIKYEFQTLSEFLRLPFGKADNRAKVEIYQREYQRVKNRIKLNAHTIIDGAYYFHVLIPSESQKDRKMMYDVVIKFIAPDKKAELSSNIRYYYIQFFSNSPSFIYRYAVLYKKHGFLIENLYKKLDPNYFDKLPQTTNPNMDISYDKSIYYACLFLSNHRFKVLNKLGIGLGKELSPKDFFGEIRDFQSIKIETDLLNLEKKSLKEADKKISKINNDMKLHEKKRELDSHRKTAVKSTATNKRVIIVGKKQAGKTTSTHKSITRKNAKKSTRRS